MLPSYRQRIQFKVREAKKTLDRYLKKIPASERKDTDILDHYGSHTYEKPYFSDILKREDVLKLNRVPEIKEVLIKRGFDPSTHAFYPIIRMVRRRRFVDGIASVTRSHDTIWMIRGWEVKAIDEIPEKVYVTDFPTEPDAVYCFEPKHEEDKKERKPSKPGPHFLKFRKMSEATMKRHVETAAKELVEIDRETYVFSTLGIAFDKLVISWINTHKSVTKESVVEFNNFQAVKDFKASIGVPEDHLAVPFFQRKDFIDGTYNPCFGPIHCEVYCLGVDYTEADNVKDRFDLIEADGYEGMLIDPKKGLSFS